MKLDFAWKLPSLQPWTSKRTFTSVRVFIKRGFNVLLIWGFKIWQILVVSQREKTVNFVKKEKWSFEIEIMVLGGSRSPVLRPGFDTKMAQFSKNLHKLFYDFVKPELLNFTWLNNFYMILAVIFLKFHIKKFSLAHKKSKIFPSQPHSCFR